MATTLKGNFKLSAHLPTEEEKRLFGIFISHSNKPKDLEYLDELAQKMTAAGMNPIYDRGFLLGGDRFQDRIRQCLNCYAAVVIISDNSLNSDWVNYEVGYFAGQGIPVVLWDPEDILSLAKGDSELLNSHISQYLPAHRSADEVVQTLDSMSIYSDMFRDECLSLTKDAFRSIVSNRIQTVMVKIESDIFDTEAMAFKNCKIGSLVVNFGMFHPENGDGCHCYAERNFPELENGICRTSKRECALYDAKELGEYNLECVVLNYLFYNGRYYRKGEKDSQGNILDRGCLVFYLPVHTFFGTEFKFIIDAPSNAQHYKLMSIFDAAGMNPTVSDSLNGRRIYLSLPERPRQGFFRLNHEFNNNFLCPYATRG
ncbi:MAG: TIR domain-containing protein [Ruminococcaceae bacterium]|nr:TIR domain-containing protein [Oscillospiraceae bacterium]